MCRSCSIPRPCSSNPTREALKRSSVPARPSIGFRRGKRSGGATTAKAVEIAKDIMPTIGLHLVRLPAGAQRAVGKTTVNHLYSVISGEARVKIDGADDESLAVGDVMTVPCWHAHTIEAAQAAIVLQVTDEPLLAKVGLVKTA